MLALHADLQPLLRSVRNVPGECASILALEIENRLGGELATFQIIETLQNIQGNRLVLHILADEVANVLARCRAHLFVASSLIDILAKRVGQLDIETTAQGKSSKKVPSHRSFCSEWQ